MANELEIGVIKEPALPNPLKLEDVLSKFSSRLSYRKKDIEALNMSRKAASGRLDDDDYKEWAAITADPIVSINYVKTFITVLKTQLAASPMRPKDDRLWAMGEAIKLNPKVDSQFEDLLNDGFSYAGVGMNNGWPRIETIDARYILHDGIDHTLRDAKNVVVFQIKPLSFQEQDDPSYENDAATEYVTYDTATEKVITSYYHEENGVWLLDIYDKNDDKPERIVLKNLTRVPIVRFTGDKVELSDKRFHYRGLYYTFGSLQKALVLAATKAQIRCATQDDSNYIASSESLMDRKESWAGVGVREYNADTLNGQKRDAPIPIPHDNQFLLNCVNIWKAAISDMLGPVVQSGSEAVTREEVMARNQVRDAIANSFLIPASESVAELYRVIQMFVTGEDKEVVIVGGMLEAAKRSKEKGELEFLYIKAKEAGLNTQGLVREMLEISDLGSEVKNRVSQSFMEDPYASPVVQQLKQQIQQLQQLMQNKDYQIALLKAQASNRLERQAEWTASQERIKRLGFQVDEWKEEQKQTQEARMALLEAAIAQNNLPLAMEIYKQISATSSPLQANPIVDQMTNQYTADITNLGENPDVQAAFNDPTIGKAQAQNVTDEGALAIQQKQMKELQLHEALLRRQQQPLMNTNVVPFKGDR